MIAPFGRLVDDQALFRFLEEYGGQRCWVPKTRKALERSPIAILLGHAAAAALSKEYGGEYPKVPVARTFRVLFLAKSGVSVGKIATRLCVDRATVQRILQPLRAMITPGVEADAAITSRPQKDLPCASASCHGAPPPGLASRSGYGRPVLVTGVL